MIVFGATGLTDATGLRTQGSTINDTTVNVAAGPQNTAVHGLGGNTFTDNTWNGGRVGFLHDHGDHRHRHPVDDPARGDRRLVEAGRSTSTTR